jgi:hypothetical protein
MDCSGLQENFNELSAVHAIHAPPLQKLILLCQEALNKLNWHTLGGLLNNAIVGLNDIYAEEPSEESMEKKIQYTIAVAYYVMIST